MINTLTRRVHRAAALTCAFARPSYLQSLVDENGDDDGEDAFGVFLLGDSPTFIKAVPKLPNIGKYFAHQPNPDTVGVTMEDNDCWKPPASFEKRARNI